MNTIQNLIEQISPGNPPQLKIRPVLRIDWDLKIFNSVEISGNPWFLTVEGGQRQAPDLKSGEPLTSICDLSQSVSCEE